MFSIVKWVVKLLILLLVIYCIYFFIINKEPSLNKNWTDDAKVLPSVKVEPYTVDVKNIRDWRYEDGTVISRNFYDAVFDSSKITKAYFLLNPFGKWDGVGHTFFLFEFNNGDSVVISVEARREEGVKYSAFKGLFNNYEMWYAWGSAADFFSRRAIYNNEDLYMYPLLIKPETARGLFMDLAKQTEKLQTQPEFYNTLTSNCTNILADSANRVNEGSIPWNLARIFTGFADDQLYELRLIPYDKPFKQINYEARIDERVREILANDKEMNRVKFWDSLKTGI